MSNRPNTVLSLCDRTGNMGRPWARAGYNVINVDIQHEGDENREGMRFIGADIRHFIPSPLDYAIVFAFPPCTNLAVSGARWFTDKGLRGLIEGLELVERCRVICETLGAPWFLENPVSTLSTYWRKPDHYFDPHEYGGYLDPPGDHYKKRTCLWTGGGFVMPPKREVEPQSRSWVLSMTNTPGKKDLGDKRSVTPRGFAEAVFFANGS